MILNRIETITELKEDILDATDKDKYDTNKVTRIKLLLELKKISLLNDINVSISNLKEFFSLRGDNNHI